MATLQKFKLLATQCALAGSPTRSPTTSPDIQFRRRKTLRLFLSRSSNSCGGIRPEMPSKTDDSTDRRVNSHRKGKDLGAVRNKLKDFFMSSPPTEEKAETEGYVREISGDGCVSTWRHLGPRSLRPLSMGLRQRTLRRRTWRPVLVTIPE